MEIINRFQYKTLEKHTYPSGARHYICPETGSKLASVTTIISATSPEKKELIEWRERVGAAQAEQTKKEALALGTLMHTHVENHIRGLPRPGGNNLCRVMAEKMADQIIEHGLVNIDEVYGSEICLYYPGLFAGTTDLCASVISENGESNLSIIDFKTAKKIRSREMIEDYLIQLAAYSIAHDSLYDTEVKQGIILMASRDYDFHKFVLEGEELKKYQQLFIERVEQYYLKSQLKQESEAS